MPTAASEPSKSGPASAFLPTRRSLLSRLRDLEDNTSWRDFFETYWKLIYSTATKAGLSDAEAQDVVQETVLTVSRQIGQFQYDPGRGSFKGWLLNTTRWRILDQLRRRKLKLQGDLPRDDSRRTDLSEEIPDPAGERVDQVWEAEWQQNLMDAAVQRIKRQVNPKHVQVFELYALKSWPAGKVASAMGVNIAQVHLIKHRIAGMLKKEVRRLQEKGV
jgi:RNA polymerase sigma factor (sigma-70 family)